MEPLLQAYLLTFLFLFGITIGSFLNVVIYRVPNDENINGRSRCPKCEHQIRWYDNIPVLSWVFLRGKCRDCKARISIRYPLVELANGLAWLGLGLYFGLDPILPLFLILASATIALTMIDFDTMTLPNIITYPIFIFTAIYLAVLAFTTDSMDNLISAGLGALIYFVFFFAMWFLTGGRGLGFGDVKLAPTLGAMIGWFSLYGSVVGIMGAFIFGGLPAGIAMAVGLVKKGTQIPFGPMLILGAWVAVFFGESLSQAYLTLF
jgi:leader peptidase (prepilin peptidase) / N-methyltransferase